MSFMVSSCRGYCAPEYIVNGKRSWKSDIYSLGVIMIELVTGSRQMPNTTKVRATYPMLQKYSCFFYTKHMFSIKEFFLLLKNNLVTSYRVDATILQPLLSPVKTNCKQLAKVLHKRRHVDDYQPVE
jgi:serine/threonine protein kinase